MLYTQIEPKPEDWKERQEEASTTIIGETKNMAHSVSACAEKMKKKKNMVSMCSRTEPYMRINTEIHNATKCIIAQRAHIHKLSSMTTRMFINLNNFLKYNKSGNNNSNQKQQHWTKAAMAKIQHENCDSTSALLKIAWPNVRVRA